MIIHSRKGAANWVRSYAGFVILIAMFTSVVLYLFLVPPDIRELMLPPIETDLDQTIFDVSPGSLSYVDEVWKTKSISLNDVEIDNTLNEEKHIVNNHFEVSSTSFNQYDSAFRFIVNTSNVESAALELIVYEKTGDGDLNIYLNDKKIYSAKPSLGDNLRVELPLYDLRSGENTVVMSASSPGAMFWAKNSYTILNLNLVTDEYNSRASSSNQVFSLTQSEAAHAENVRLYAYILKNSEDNANVELYVNGDRIYKAMPQTNFVLDVSSDSLVGGANTVSWSVDRGGSYSIKQAVVTMDTVKTRGKQTNYIFDIGVVQYDYVESDNYACELSLEYGSGGDQCTVNINSNVKEVNFASDTITMDICNDLKRGRNTIRFYTEGDDISLSKATLTIENK